MRSNLVIPAIALMTRTSAYLTPNGTCDAICSPISDLADACGYTLGSGMSSMMQRCMCNNTSFNVSEISPMCDSCLGEAQAGQLVLSASVQDIDAKMMSVSSMMGGGSSAGGGMMSGMTTMMASHMGTMMSYCSFRTTSYVPADTTLVEGIKVTASPVTGSAALSTSATSTETASSTSNARRLGGSDGLCGMLMLSIVASVLVSGVVLPLGFLHAV